MKIVLTSHIGLDWQSASERHSSFQLIGQDKITLAGVDMSHFLDESRPKIRRIYYSPRLAQNQKNLVRSLKRWALKMHKKSKPFKI